MKKQTIAIGVGLFLLGFVFGVAGSQRYWSRWALAMQRQEVVGRADKDIVILSKWRTGSEAEALAELEAMVDRAVETVYGSAKAFEKKMPEPDVRMIQLAKVYRTAYPPPTGSSPALLEALDSVGMPDRKYCSPALQKLLEDVESKVATPGGR